jgi:hypothetical protein
MKVIKKVFNDDKFATKKGLWKDEFEIEEITKNQLESLKNKFAWDNFHFEITNRNYFFLTIKENENELYSKVDKIIDQTKKNMRMIQVAVYHG